MKKFIEKKIVDILCAFIIVAALFAVWLIIYGAIGIVTTALNLTFEGFGLAFISLIIWFIILLIMFAYMEKNTNDFTEDE